MPSPRYLLSDDFGDEGFPQQLADKICRLGGENIDVENVEDMMHEVKRTCGSNAKIRDTFKSSLVTDMLMAILAGFVYWFNKFGNGPGMMS